MNFTVRSEVDKDSLWTSLPTDKPVLFWDSCGLLDCLRIGVRYNKSYYDNYRRLLSLILNGDVVSVLSKLVLHETSLNWDNVCLETDRHQKKLQEDVFSLVHIHSGDEAVAEAVRLRLSNANVLDRTMDIVQRIIENSYLVKEHVDFLNFAHFRLINKVAPAHKKNEYKDCYIWGCTNMCANIRPDKNRKVFFISSNTDDYSSKDVKNRLDDRIVDDCRLNYIDFARNIGELREKLDRI